MIALWWLITTPPPHLPPRLPTLCLPLLNLLLILSSIYHLICPLPFSLLRFSFIILFTSDPNPSLLSPQLFICCSCFPLLLYAINHLFFFTLHPVLSPLPSSACSFILPWAFHPSLPHILKHLALGYSLTFGRLDFLVICFDILFLFHLPSPSPKKPFQPSSLLYLIIWITNASQGYFIIHWGTYCNSKIV